MEPRKKRKVEPAAPAQPMSAFAIRKLRMQQKEAEARAARATQQALQSTPAAPVNGSAVEKKPAPEEETGKPSTATPRKRTLKQTEKPEPDVTSAAVSPPKPEQKPVEALPVQNATFISDGGPNRSSPSERPLPSPRPQATAILRSSFQPTKQNFHEKADGSKLLKLIEDERLVVLGSYGLSVRTGEVTLAGAVLRASEKVHWIHAPRCHALPVIRCTDDAAIILQPHPATRGLRRLAALSPVFSHLWNEHEAGSSETADASYQILYTTADGPTSRDLTAPAEWNKLISELTLGKNDNGKQGQPVFFVCGPKSSGKSTFSRLLVNRLLTANTAEGGSNGGNSKKKRSRKWTSPSVAVLDIDPGQPEFGTPGALSLVHVQEPNFTPTFCHPYVPSDSNGNRLLRAHEFASILPASDPEHYVACVLDLFSLYHRDLRSRCPLLINTPGWIQGLGLAILVRLISYMRPSRVIYMSCEGPGETVRSLKSAYQNLPFVELPSQPSDIRIRTAAHLRTMQTMSYFHLDLDSPARINTQQKGLAYPGLQWTETSITAMRPWVVPYVGEESGILGVICYDTQPPPNLLADSINGMVVSIVAIENIAAFRAQQPDVEMDRADDADGAAADQDTQPTQTAGRLPPTVRSPEGIPYILNATEEKLDPRYSHRIGVALVRGIDSANRELHLLCPLDAGDAIDEILRQDGLGVVLVSGKVDSPTWAYTEDLYLLQSKNEEEEGDGDDVDDDAKTNEDTDEESAADDEAEIMAAGHEHGQKPPPLPSSAVPWVEVMEGRQKRAMGSRVWRVRRDLGRNKGSSSGNSGGHGGTD